MRPLPLTALVLAVALLAAGGGYLAYRRAATFAETGAASAVAIGGPFALADGNGRAVTDRDLRGKYLLVYFGYTHCPDACPTALNAMAVALGKLGPKQAEVTPVFITVDPERDTPAVMKSYAASFGPQFLGLTGTPAQINAVEGAYHVYAAKHPTGDGGYEMDHSSIIYMMGPDGAFVTTLAADAPPDEIAASLSKLVS